MKIGAALVLQQQGWCVAFTPAKPMVRESTGKPHSWDIRADWLADDPTCSAVMTRSFRDTFALPVWFFNLPPPDDAPHRAGYGAGEIPVRVDVFGFIDVGAEGSLDIVTGPGMGASLRVDGARVDAREPGHHQVALSPGTHGIQMEAMLATKHWPIVPAWNGHADGVDVLSRRPRSSRRRDSIEWRGRSAIGCCCCSAADWCSAWLASFALRLRDLGLLIWSTAAAVAVSIGRDVDPDRSRRLHRGGTHALLC